MSAVSPTPTKPKNAAPNYKQRGYEQGGAHRIEIKREPNRHDLPAKASVCCFGVSWDDAYEFTAPVSNKWYKRLARAFGFGERSYEGTMYDIVDELQICSHITQLQAQQLYALVRVAMGLQYKAEKSMTQHIFLMTLAAICGAVVPVVVGVQTTLEDKSVAMYMSYAAIALSLLQTLAGTLANVGQFNQNAIMMRMTAAEIKAEIYKFQGLAGEYSDPPDYQVQFPRLMHHLAEFRQKAVVAQFQARGGQDGGSKRNKEEAARKDLDAKMVADGHRGV